MWWGLYKLMASLLYLIIKEAYISQPIVWVFSLWIYHVKKLQKSQKRFGIGILLLAQSRLP